MKLPLIWHRPGAGSARPVLPLRVREAIGRHQASSEILIGWIQLAVVSIFATLYWLAPNPYEEPPEIVLEPPILWAYVVFTLVRLFLAHRRRLPNWLLYVSTVLDMALLLGLIWSIHIKYEQPASFYLKVPTLLYVFIFIALRALRFEVRYVVIAGLVAAGGWLAMVWYVISIEPNDPMITRNYVQYLTSNSVLLGAEFDKVISILMVTAILAVAIARARRLLVASLVEHATAEELSRFVPENVVRQVTNAQRPLAAGDGEVREATILFTDIEGFTSVSEKLAPRALIEMLNDYFAVVSEPITRYGGVINQFQGDAILATFNVPEALPEHAAGAVRAAQGIQDVLAGRRFGNDEDIRLRARVGVNTGIVVGGLVGTGERLGYTVHGDEVNLAARLEQLNKEHATRILVSERTRELAGPDRFAFQRIGEVSVRGRLSPVVVYTLGGVESTAREPGPNPLGSSNGSQE